MKTLKTLLLTLLTGVLTPGLLLAQSATTAISTSEGWHPKSLVEALLLTALFSLAGVALAVVGYKLFDKFTTGDLHKEIIENKNVAAAIVGAAVILGVCIIIAAAIMG